MSNLLALPEGGAWRPHILHATESAQAPVVRRRVEHTHAVYHIVYFHEGAGSVMVEGEQKTVAKGSLVLLSPEQKHAFERKKGDTNRHHEVTWSYVNESDDLLYDPISKVLSRWSDVPVGIPAMPVTLGQSKRIAVESALLELASNFGSGGRDERFRSTLILSRLFSILIELFREKEKESSNPFSVARDYLEFHFREEIDLSRLSKIAGVSYNYLSRRFKEYYGVTPMRYLQEIRLVEAEVLLKATDYTLAHIGSRVGIADEIYLSKLLKARHGVSPGKWRRLVRDGPVHSKSPGSELATPRTSVRN